MIAAWRLPGARFVTVEAQEESVRLARKSAAYNGLGRALRDPARRLPVAGRCSRADERFDLVLGSPPYFPPGTGIEGEHPQKVACRFELRGDIGDYCAVARRTWRRAGCLPASFPRSSGPRVGGRGGGGRAGHRAAAAGGVQGRRAAARHAVRDGARRRPARARCATQTWVEPPLVIRAADGSVHPEYAAVKLSIGFPP